jgi:hypothetical protein
MVMYDDRNKILHLNPGAAGKSGLHKFITCLRFVVDGKSVKEMEILEKDRKKIVEGLS